jgi:predicted PurR-regulated permease PerM
MQAADHEHLQGSPEPTIRVTAATLFILLLFAASIWILMPFLEAVIWGLIIAISAYPAFTRLSAALRGRRKLSAVIVGLLLAVVLFVPLVVLVLKLGGQVGELIARVPDVDPSRFQTPPAWLAGIPILGRRLNDLWTHTFADFGGTMEALRPQIRNALEWILPHVISSTLIVLEAALAIVLSAVFLLAAPRFYEFFVRFLGRLGAQDPIGLTAAVEKTTRSVSKGILGTALIQAAIAWVGFVIVGAPAPIFLAFIALILCSMQFGIVIIGVPLAIWLWTSGDWGYAIFIIVWSVFVSVVDNALKPILLGHDVPAPIWVLFLGILGGLLSMGLIGLFIGPILLAVSYQLIVHWTYA